MSKLDVQRSISIAAPSDVVRRQFGDVAHHAETGVHRGVRFEVIDDHPARCRYRQISRVGPIRLVQELELDRHRDGQLVNTVVRGQFEGGSISFDVQPNGADRSTVRARLQADVRGLAALVAPVLRHNIGRALDRALAEDREDLESGRYDGSVDDSSEAA